MSDTPAGFSPIDWKAWPHTAWAFRNVERFLPVARVAAAERRSQMPGQAASSFDMQLRVGELGLSWPEYLDRVHATSALAIRSGRLIAETYRQGAEAADRQTLFSITKTLIGLAALILIERGTLDPRRTAGDFVPELKGSAFDDAIVADLLAMRDGVPFDENYLDLKAQIHAYSRHYWGGAPDGTLPALASLPQGAAQPGRFAYRTPVADVIGWVLRRASGMPLSRLMSELIWRPIGSEADALMILDRGGAEIAGTGFTARPRDLARLALALLDPDSEVFSQQVRDRMFAGGDSAVVAAAGYATRPGWSYANLSWCPGPDQLAALGVHGQRMFLDRTERTALIVIAAAPQPDTRHLDRFHEAALRSLTRLR